MRILDAWTEADEKQAVPAEVIKADLPKLQAAHDRAKREDPTWEFFGGILTIDQRKYQVV